MTAALQITTPPGRIVQGDVWSLNLQYEFTDKTKPKLGKDGQQISERFIGLAIPKGQLWDTFWARLYAVGMEGYNNAVPGNMSWKVTDGDLAIHAAKDGFPGHWVLAMSTQFETQVVNAQHEQIIDHAQAKRGDYADVLIDIKCDGHTTNPSVYISPKIVRILQAGPVIVGGANVDDMGAVPAVPAGALPATAGLPPMAGPGTPPVPPATVTPPPPVTTAPPVPPSPAPAPSATPPVPPTTQAAPPVPPAPPVATASPGEPVMTATATNTRAEYHAAQWTDEQLVAAGFMIMPHVGFAGGPQ